MADRYYAPDLADAVDDYTLTEAEAHHLAHVCRARVGEEVELFDGRGLRAAAVVEHVGKRAVELRIGERTRSSEAAGGPVIGSALPKGDRALFLVEKCTELGVGSLTPLHTERSVVSPSDSKVEKLRRSVIEACKQCGRDQLMEVAEPRQWRSFAESKPAEAVGWLLHPSGESAENSAPDWIAIGPEGGWSDTEVDAFQQLGWRTVRFPGNILRVETAAVALAAIAAWGKAGTRTLHAD